MASVFIDLLPDETVHSGVSSLFDVMGCSSAKKINALLFGNAGARSITDLACRLDHLIEVLPSGHGYTVDQIINQHTLFPFYAPFLPTERSNRLKEDMRGSDASGMHLRAGITTKGIYSPDWLRFCPVCVKEDRAKYRRTFWHRNHQIPGVEICFIHGVLLENSSARTRNRINPHELLSAEQAVHPVEEIRWLDASDPCSKFYLNIAVNAAWLLDQNNLTPGIESLHKRYHNLLAERDLASYASTIRPDKLRQAFRDYYPPEFLERMNCEVDDRRINWLLRLVRDSFEASHPLHHLLLIGFFNHSAESFFALSDEPSPFGSGLGLCLNPVCTHFQQKVTSCDISISCHDSRPRGVFSCPHCGFTYCRKGPDQSPEDRLRIGLILSRGHLWESKLREWWVDPTLSVSEIAHRLGAAFTTVKAYAVQLKLVSPKPSTHARTTHIELLEVPKTEVSEPSIQDKIRTYRDEWLEVRATYPDADRHFLVHTFSRLSVWLRRHDRDWYEQNLPPIVPRTPSVQQISVFNWEAYDRELAVQVEQVADRLLKDSGRPVHISLSAIFREIPRRRPIQNNLHQLPITAEVLKRVTESYENWAIRRIWWAANIIHQKNVFPTHSRLIKQACLSKIIQERTDVKQALESALQWLTSTADKNVLS